MIYDQKTQPVATLWARRPTFKQFRGRYHLTLRRLKGGISGRDQFIASSVGLGVARVGNDSLWSRVPLRLTEDAMNWSLP